MVPVKRPGCTKVRPVMNAVTLPGWMPAAGSMPRTLNAGTPPDGKVNTAPAATGTVVAPNVTVNCPPPTSGSQSRREGRIHRHRWHSHSPPRRPGR